MNNVAFYGIAFSAGLLVLTVFVVNPIYRRMNPLKKERIDAWATAWALLVVGVLLLASAFFGGNVNLERATTGSACVVGGAYVIATLRKRNS